MFFSPSSIPSGPSVLLIIRFVKIKEKPYWVLKISVIDIEREIMLFNCWKCKLLVYRILEGSILSTKTVSFSI